MDDIKKKTFKYITISVISFLTGILFTQFVLNKYFNFPQQVKEENLEQENSQVSEDEQKKDKKIKKEDGCTFYVDVSGALKEPGVYCFNSSALVIDAVNKAGGFTKNVAISYISRKINLSLPLTDNQKLYFPFEKEVECELQSFLPYTESAEVEEPSTSDQDTSSPVESSTEDDNTDTEIQCVNINTASKEELTTLSGIGDVTAEKMIQGRPYQKIEDLLNVSGIGEATLNKFKDKICV
ncbi:MAG: helix-hairpin-helix domain-containing protein [Candidatus Dojkabacteria bacterium]